MDLLMMIVLLNMENFAIGPSLSLSISPSVFPMPLVISGTHTHTEKPTGSVIEQKT